MAISNAQSRLLHFARRQLRLPDDEYRTILLKLGDVDSSADLTQAGFDLVYGYFEHLGFEPLRTVGPYYGHRRAILREAEGHPAPCR